MSISSNHLKELELAMIRPLQGGRITNYSLTELRWEPYHHNKVSLHNGRFWEIFGFDYLSLSCSGVDFNNAQIVGNKQYDVYINYNEGNPRLDLVPWFNDLSRTIYPFNYNGVLVYNSTTEQGVKLRFIGSIRTVVSGGDVSFINTKSQRFVVNWDNPIISAVQTYHQAITNTTFNPSNGRPGYNSITEFNYGSGMIRGEFLVIHP